MLTEHLFHEVQMTFFLAAELQRQAGARVDVSLRNAHIEAFDLHLESLLRFFWGERPRTEGRRDAFAADFYPDGEWQRLRPELPRILAGDDRRFGLVYEREWERPADKVWDVVTQAFALAPVVRLFAETVDDSQFTPGYVHGMRVCAEEFAGARRAQAA